MEYQRLAILADKPVGVKTVQFLYEKYRNYLKAIVVVNEQSDVYQLLGTYGLDKKDIILHNKLYQEETLMMLQKLNLDFMILAWWPFIVKEPLLGIPKIGIINFHPSLLPYNRGKHYNFWTIVENTPFGVSMHFIDNNIDSGDIIFQKEIPKTWEDTGESLYFKAQDAMVNLFIENFPFLIKGEFTRIKQDLSLGTFHVGKELEPASKIVLDGSYKAKDLLNLLRARTFKEHPACYFFDDGKKYEVRIEIRECS